jgi:hypothetical protein
MKKELIKKDENNELTDSAQTNKVSNKKSKPIYKKAWFWIGLFISVSVIIMAIFVALYFGAQSKNRQIISKGWFEIVEKNKTLSQLAEKIESQETYDSYNSELKKLSVLVDENKFASQKLQYKQIDAKKYDNFINEYQKYTNQSIFYSDRIKEYTDSDKEKLKVLSEPAKATAADLKNEAKYLKDEMPSSTFGIQDILFEANKVILTSELSAKTKLLTEQAATAKDNLDKKSAENTAGNFLNAFLAGNAPLMRQYMTEAYQKEYDFNQLSPESRTTTYPASFRILNNQKLEDGKYKVQANVLFKFRDGSSQYIVGYEMNVIYDSNQSKWLINSSKEGSSF